MHAQLSTLSAVLRFPDGQRPRFATPPAYGYTFPVAEWEDVTVTVTAHGTWLRGHGYKVKKNGEPGNVQKSLHAAVEDFPEPWQTTIRGLADELRNTLHTWEVEQ